VGASRNRAAVGQDSTFHIMPPLFPRFPRLAFFLAGAAISTACVWFLTQWMAIANGWLGLGITYATRPVWLVGLMSVAAILPWLLFATVLILRWRRGVAYKPVVLALGLLLPYVVAIAWLFLRPPLEDRWHRRTFDSRLWKANQAVDHSWPDRLCMVDDLMATVPLLGLSKSRLIELLGPGDHTRAWARWGAVYFLGPERGMFRIDSEMLVVRFDQDDRVVEYRIVTD
jgi:hypothetical protein